MDLHDIRAFILYFYVTIRTWLSLKWIRYCQWVVQPRRYIKSRSDYYHKIVLVGDGFAEGFGDSVTFGTCGGLSSHLAKLIKKEPKIRHTWQIINRGIAFTSSEDWKPTSKTGIFRNVFGDQKFADADIVIIMLGSMDTKNHANPISPETTLENLRDICDALRKKDKKILLSPICNLQTGLNGDEEQRKTNKLIKEFIASTSIDDYPIISGPDLSLPQFRRPDSRAFDGSHLNSKSYKLLAKNTMEMLTPAITAVEWAVWKHKIDTIHYDPSLYN